MERGNHLNKGMVEMGENDRDGKRCHGKIAKDGEEARAQKSSLSVMVIATKPKFGMAQSRFPGIRVFFFLSLFFFLGGIYSKMTNHPGGSGYAYPNHGSYQSEGFPFKTIDRLFCLFFFFLFFYWEFLLLGIDFI